MAGRPKRGLVPFSLTRVSACELFDESGALKTPGLFHFGQQATQTPSGTLWTGNPRISPGPGGLPGMMFLPSLRQFNSVLGDQVLDTVQTNHYSAHMSIIDNINAGKYKNNLPYSRHAAPPSTAERRERAEYRAETDRLDHLFQADLFEEYGVAGNPKAAKCYSIAWDLGHSAGLQEVANYFDDLVVLIK